MSSPWLPPSLTMAGRSGSGAMLASSSRTRVTGRGARPAGHRGGRRWRRRRPGPAPGRPPRWARPAAGSGPGRRRRRCRRCATRRRGSKFGAAQLSSDGVGAVGGQHARRRSTRCPDSSRGSVAASPLRTSTPDVDAVARPAWPGPGARSWRSTHRRTVSMPAAAQVRGVQQRGQQGLGSARSSAPTRQCGRPGGPPRPWPGPAPATRPSWSPRRPATSAAGSRRLGVGTVPLGSSSQQRPDAGRLRRGGRQDVRLGGRDHHRTGRGQDVGDRHRRGLSRPGRTEHQHGVLGVGQGQSARRGAQVEPTAGLARWRRSCSSSGSAVGTRLLLGARW